MTEHQIEDLLRSWNPSKGSEKSKEELWNLMQEKMGFNELSDEQLDLVAGGINSTELIRKKKR